MHFNKVTLVGVGLLGGSLGLALKQRQLAAHVAGYVRREASLAECRQFQVVDEATLDLAAAVDGADLIVFCTPLAQMKELAVRLLPHLKKGALVTDVGSVKNTVVRQLEGLFQKAGAFFVGSHPMAGSEKTGPSAARADLFAQAVCILTPTAKSNAAAVAKIAELWTAVGARILYLKPRLHDELVSRSSHLPHLVAAQLARFVLDPARPAEQARLCATGFRDTTRIASGPPPMWRDIVLANRQSLDTALGLFIKELQSLRRSIARGDVEAIERILAQAKSERDAWCEKLASRSQE